VVFGGFVELQKKKNSFGILGSEWGNLAGPWQAEEPDQLVKFFGQTGEKSEGLESHCRLAMLRLEAI
jgi:hypothetical protein